MDHVPVRSCCASQDLPRVPVTLVLASLTALLLIRRPLLLLLSSGLHRHLLLPLPPAPAPAAPLLLPGRHGPAGSPVSPTCSQLPFPITHAIQTAACARQRTSAMSDGHGGAA